MTFTTYMYSDRILVLYKCISIKGYVIEIVGINYNSIITWNTTLYMSEDQSWSLDAHILLNIYYKLKKYHGVHINTPYRHTVYKTHPIFNGNVKLVNNQNSLSSFLKSQYIPFTTYPGRTGKKLPRVIKRSKLI